MQTTEFAAQYCFDNGGVINLGKDYHEVNLAITGDGPYSATVHLRLTPAEAAEFARELTR